MPDAPPPVDGLRGLAEALLHVGVRYRRPSGQWLLQVPPECAPMVTPRVLEQLAERGYLVAIRGLPSADGGSDS